MIALAFEKILFPTKQNVIARNIRLQDKHFLSNLLPLFRIDQLDEDRDQFLTACLWPQ